MSKRHAEKAKARAELRFRIEKCGDDELSFTEAFLLMLELHQKGGYAPLDPAEATGNFYRALKCDATFIARKDEGKGGEDPLIGILSLAELQFWYSKETYFEGIGFYVKPEYRRGKVGIALLRAAGEEADKRDKLCFVTITDPDRRPKATRLSLEAQIAGWVPLGHRIRLR